MSLTIKYGRKGPSMHICYCEQKACIIYAVTPHGVKLINCKNLATIFVTYPDFYDENPKVTKKELEALGYLLRDTPIDTQFLASSEFREWVGQFL